MASFQETNLGTVRGGTTRNLTNFTLLYDGDPSTPVDLTGAVASIQFRFDKERGDVVKTLDSDTTGGLTISNPTDGIVTLDAFLVDMDDWQYGTYYYDLRITWSPTLSKIWVGGTLIVSKNQTDENA